MPIYEYSHCGKIYERIKPVGTEEIACPECGGVAKKILSMPGRLLFKGSGWTTPRAIETFKGEPDDPSKWNSETHGVKGSLERSQED